jgi:hypothetical protein
MSNESLTPAVPASENQKRMNQSDVYVVIQYGDTLPQKTSSMPVAGGGHASYLNRGCPRVFKLEPPDPLWHRVGDTKQHDTMVLNGNGNTTDKRWNHRMPNATLNTCGPEITSEWRPWALENMKQDKFRPKSKATGKSVRMTRKKM